LFTELSPRSIREGACGFSGRIGVLDGNDASHAHSTSWALKKLMPQAEMWEVLPPHQNGQNTPEQVLRFTSRLEAKARVA